MHTASLLLIFTLFTPPATDGPCEAVVPFATYSEAVCDHVDQVSHLLIDDMGVTVVYKSGGTMPVLEPNVRPEADRCELHGIRIIAETQNPKLREWFCGQPPRIGKITNLHDEHAGFCPHEASCYNSCLAYEFKKPSS